VKVTSNHGGQTSSADIVQCGEESSVSTDTRPSPLYSLSSHASVQMRTCGRAGAPSVIFREGRMPFSRMMLRKNCMSLSSGEKCVTPRDSWHLSTRGKAIALLILPKRD